MHGTLSCRQHEHEAAMVQEEPWEGQDAVRGLFLPVLTCANTKFRNI